MQIILQFENGEQKRKELPVDVAPHKLMFGKLEPELYEMVNKIEGVKQGDVMGKVMEDQILFELTSEFFDGKPIYKPASKIESLLSKQKE